MFLKEALENVDLARIKNGTLNTLSRSEKDRIAIFINALLDEDNCQVIFRGENKKNAFDYTGVIIEENSDEDKQFCEHGDSVFYIGSKAKSYLHSTEELDFPIKLNEISEEIFGKIFVEFKKLNRLIPHKFEHKFIEYFEIKTEDFFINSICFLNDEEKRIIKLYYLWLLHVIGESEYKKYSNFVSTTKNFEVAKLYSNNEFVYCGWIPRPIKERSIYLGSTLQVSRKLKSLGLPVYKSEPYSNEQEISLIGGFFSHYMLGIYHLPKKMLLVNTNLFTKENLKAMKEGMSEAIINLGIRFDQSNFFNSEIYRKSKYKRYLSYMEGKGYTDH